MAFDQILQTLALTRSSLGLLHIGFFFFVVFFFVVFFLLQKYNTVMLLGYC